MATTTKALYRGAATTSGTAAPLYTVPATGTTAVITNIAVCNPLASTSTFSLNIGGIALAATSAMAPSTTTFIDLKQVLEYNATTSNMQITASAVTTAVTFHISGIEIS
ncbi:hypothetical protein EB001_17030 [bacterium]|nr:hypothetical protein [bacterium]